MAELTDGPEHTPHSCCPASQSVGQQLFNLLIGARRPGIGPYFRQNVINGMGGERYLLQILLLHPVPDGRLQSGMEDPIVVCVYGVQCAAKQGGLDDAGACIPVVDCLGIEI
jgi:hypothetical protein